MLLEKNVVQNSVRMAVCKVITHIQRTLMGFVMLGVPGDGVMG